MQAPAKEPFELDMNAMAAQAADATAFMKALAHQGRLTILCRLVEGECSVAELETLLSARQAAVSQQLARLRQEGVVGSRRDGKQIYYFLTDERVKRMITVLHEMFCDQETAI